MRVEELVNQMTIGGMEFDAIETGTKGVVCCGDVLFDYDAHFCAGKRFGCRDFQISFAVDPHSGGQWFDSGRCYQPCTGGKVKVLYCLKVPKGGKLLTVRGSHEKELQVSYPDSSFIYITNDAKSGSHLNYDNVAAVNKSIYTEKLLKDTLLLEGTQNDGRLWKENKLGEIVVGYVNVPAAKKESYDQSLASLKIK